MHIRIQYAYTLKIEFRIFIDILQFSFCLLMTRYRPLLKQAMDNPPALSIHRSSNTEIYRTQQDITTGNTVGTNPGCWQEKALKRTIKKTEIWMPEGILKIKSGLTLFIQSIEKMCISEIITKNVSFSVKSMNNRKYSLHIRVAL